MTPQPPDWAQTLLALFVPARGRDGVLGDLLEEYHETQVPEHGASGADAWYVRQMLGFLWRQCLPWGLLVSAIMITRDVVDVAVPSPDLRLRAAVTTWVCIAAFGIAGLYAGWRAQRALSGTVIGFIAGVVTCIVATLYAIAASWLAGPSLAGNPAAYAALLEARDVPIIPIIILGTLAGSIGGGFGRTLMSGPRRIDLA